MFPKLENFQWRPPHCGSAAPRPPTSQDNTSGSHAQQPVGLLTVATLAPYRWTEHELITADAALQNSFTRPVSALKLLAASTKARLAEHRGPLPWTKPAQRDLVRVLSAVQESCSTSV